MSRRDRSRQHSTTIAYEHVHGNLRAGVQVNVRRNLTICKSIWTVQVGMLSRRQLSNTKLLRRK
jgi:hypothetical protein